MAAPKPFVPVPGVATIANPKPIATPASITGRAGVQKRYVQMQETPAQSEEEPTIFEASPSSRATLVDSSEMDQPEQEQADATSNELPAWAEGFTPEDVAKISEFKSDDDLKKAYLNLQRKIGTQGNEKAGLEQMVQDILAAQGLKPQASAQQAAPVQAVPPVDLKKLQDEIAKNWLDEPEKNVERIMSAADQLATARAQSIFDNWQAKQDQKTIDRLIKSDEYKTVINKDNAVLIDAMAAVAPGETIAEKYEHALRSYKKDKQPGSVSANASERAEAERMAQAAQGQTAPTVPSNNAGQKKKVFSRQWLQTLMANEPEKYRSLQPEIMRAYAEGRVK